MSDNWMPLRERVDQKLKHYLDSGDVPPLLRESMRYSVFNGGKRIRPILLYLGCEIFGVDPAKADSTAAAIEFIHAYSLVHDDLPAMDDDDLRRGKPTTHIQYDEATAILAADALQTLAFSVIAEDASLDGNTRARLVAALAAASGAEGMVAGQVLDIAAENSEVTLEELEAIHRRKTGALIRCALTSAGIIAGAGDDQIAALEQYGDRLGLAFQVQDDILDVTGDTAKLGKTAGSDENNNKSTYVSICGLEQAKAHLQDLHDEAINALAPFHNQATGLVEMADFVIRRDH